MSERKNHIDAAIIELERLGAEAIRVVKGRVHPRIVFQWKGEQKFLVVSGTPSDNFRTSHNIKSDIRHLLGVVKDKKKIGNRRVAKNYAPPPAASVAPITLMADPFAALTGHPLMPDVTRLRYERAWRGFWVNCMASVGARSLLADPVDEQKAA